MRKIEFAPEEYYHLFNHGVDNRIVFNDDNDFKRFLICLTLFNDEENSPSNLTRFVFNPALLTNKYNPDSRKRLVDIIAFTATSTHFHLFIRERVKNGTSRFMHRLLKGYACYFNLKNERRGSLWQGAFGAKHVDNEPYFIHIISYIHLNVLDLYFPEWRKGKIKDWSKAAPKLVSYPWSSYAHYRTGSSQISFIDLILTKPEWLKEHYPNPKIFEENLYSWSTRES